MARVIRTRGGDAAIGDAQAIEDLRAEARAELAVAIAGVERARMAVLADAEATIGALAIAVAERILGEALDVQPERVRTVVSEALERVRRAKHVRVRVHPSDAAQLVDLEVEIVEDASVTRGGCVVESELGEVDARLEVRLDALARAIGAR